MIDTTVSPDGNNYGFPGYGPNPWNQVAYRMYINREWLTKLGLQEPKTTDELRNVLLAFRDRDPNGNGRQDEMGIFTRYGTQDTMIALINAFIYFQPVDLALDSTGNTVTAPFADPAFRRALQYLNGLFRERLIEPSSFTVDSNGYQAVLNGNPAVVGLTSIGSVNYFSDTYNNPNFLAMIPMLAPLSSPGSPGYTPFTLPVPGAGTFITNKAKNVDLAVKVMDSFYDEDISIIMQYGEENVDWTRDPALLRNYTNGYIAMGVIPGALWGRLKDVWTMPTNRHWGTRGPRYWPAEMVLGAVDTFGDVFDPNNPASGPALNADSYRLYYPRHPEYILPPLNFNPADSITLAEPRANINEYVRLSIAEFVTSIRDINSDTAWNAYLRELDNMGLQQWLRMAQAQYNRQK